MRDYNFLIVTTSKLEYQFIQQTFQETKSLDSRRTVCYNGSRKILLLRSDPGIFSLSYYFTKELLKNEFDLVINAGICGSFKNDLGTGEVVRVVSDRFVDIGREDGKNLFEMGLMDENEFPFIAGEINDNPGVLYEGIKRLPKVRAITVNRVTQSKENFIYICTRYKPDIETMEGAAFFFIAALEKLNYIQVRVVSNMVGIDDRSGWEIENALSLLSKELKIILA